MSTEPSTGLLNQHILVIDDDRRIRQMIQWALEEEGFRVSTAADGQQGLEQALSARPALIVLDLNLPVLDGAGMAEELQRAADAPPPILLVTADDHPAEWARRVGAYAYLRKPFDLDALVAAVQRRLQGQSA